MFIQAPCLILAFILATVAAAAQDGGSPTGDGAGQPATAADGEAADAAAMSVVAIIDKAVTDRDPTNVRPVFATLDENWSRMSPKSIKRVNKSISAMFAKLKPRESRDVDTLGEDARDGRFTPDEDDPEPATDDQMQEVFACYHSAIGLLYDKPEGPSVLLPVLKLPHVKTWPEVKVLVIEGLGYRGEAALLKDFEACVSDENSAVASAAAGALGQLREQPIEVRRRAVSVIVDAFSAAEKASEKEASKVGEDDDRPARRYLASVMLAYREALASLTRQSFEKPAEWREWFDAHGRDASW